jgi:hypothetical protein
MDKLTVKLTYFKESGKYYATGEFTSEGNFLFEIIKEVEKFHSAGKLPGLVEGAGLDFKILIQHEGSPPHLFVP